MDKKISIDKQWENWLYSALCEAGFPEPLREYKFLEKRKFRFDFAWPDYKFAVECDGGVFTRGRHVTGVGYTRDRCKMNLALIEGWRVMGVTTGQANNGQALEWIKEFWDKQLSGKPA